jgi:two-component system, NtrC family, response regulator AtoC
MSLNLEQSATAVGIVAIPSNALPFVGGVSPAIRALERVIADVAPTDIPILVAGESGTGKEAVALELHRRSRNCNEPFIKCSCGGLIVESLRIHLVNGAKAGGEPSNRGGTTFFDDVGRLDAASQNVLLQFLSDSDSARQNGFLRDRVISSTSCNLEEEMRAGRFREELYYRINGVCLRLPALRQRQEDVPLLLDHFLKKYASAFERPEPRLSSTAMDFLRQHSWPGNIRELENFARKLVILGGEELALSDLALGSALNKMASHQTGNVNDHPNKARSLKAAAREASRSVERELILNSLERTHWNRKRTARELQISYKALLYKLKQLDIDGAADLAEQSTQAPR